MTALLVALAAGAGAGLRHLVDRSVAAAYARGSDLDEHPKRFPLGILVVNLSGCLLLGLLVGRQRAGFLSPNAFRVLGVGLCGGYTTFSTWAVDVALLVRAGQRRDGAVDVAVTLAGGIAAAALGLALAS